MTRFRLALYDPAIPGQASGYWTWYHPDLSEALLEQLYYEFARHHVPEIPGQLTPDHVCGGCAALDAQWCAWYRFLNGGRDRHGRPGRYVLLAAFTDREAISGLDSSAVLMSDPFHHVMMAAPQVCPVPAPPTLAISEPLPEIAADEQWIQQACNNSRMHLQGDGDVLLAKAAMLCAHLTEAHRWHCRIELADRIKHMEGWVVKETTPHAAGSGAGSASETPAPSNAHDNRGLAPLSRLAAQKSGVRVMLAILSVAVMLGLSITVFFMPRSTTDDGSTGNQSSPHPSRDSDSHQRELDEKAAQTDENQTSNTSSPDGATKTDAPKQGTVLE